MTWPSDRQRIDLRQAQKNRRFRRFFASFLTEGKWCPEELSV
jgi:hypothetical protein